MSVPSGLPKITGAYLAETISKSVTNVVGNVKVPNMGGGSFLAETAKAVAAVAQKSASAENITLAFEKANSQNTALAYQEEAQANFSSGIFGGGKSNDTGRG